MLISSKGSALTMALIAALGVGALSLIILNRTKVANRIANKYESDAEVDAAVLNITAFLLNPRNCNATFKGLNVPPNDVPNGVPPTGANLAAILACSSGNCYSPGSTTTAAFSVVAKNSTDWNYTATGFKGSSTGNVGKEASRIRLSEIRYWKYSEQTYNSTPEPGRPAILRIQLAFQKQVGSSAKHISGTNFDAEMKTSIVVRDIFIPIVRGTASRTQAYSSSTTILGCPKSPSSTAIYGS